MPADESAYAPLTAAMIRRAPPLPAIEPNAAGPVAEPDAPAAWREDLRLFVVTWAAGFVFFLAFIG